MDSQTPEFWELVESRIPYALAVARDLKRILGLSDSVDVESAALEGLHRAAAAYHPLPGIPFSPRMYIRGRILDLLKGKIRNATVELDYEVAGEFEDPAEDLDREIIAKLIHRSIESLPFQMQRLIELRYLEEKSWEECRLRLKVTATQGYRQHRKALALLAISIFNATTCPTTRPPKRGCPRPFEDRLKDLIMTKSNTEKQRIDRTMLKAEVDELGPIQEKNARFEDSQEFQDHQDRKKREKELKDKLTTYLPKDLPGAEEFSLEGDKWVVNISAARNERYVIEGGMAKIMQWMTKARFLLKCSVTMKILDGELSEEQQAEVIRKGHVGYRSFDTERLRTEAKKAA